MTISFNLAPDASLGQAVDAIHKAELAIHLPPSVHADFQGTAQAFTSSLQNEPLLVARRAARRLHRARDALRELRAPGHDPVDAALGGHRRARGAACSSASISASSPSSGLLLLIGIVKKNAILLIDFAIEAERNEGASPEDAIVRACSLRFRPILMTTFAALFGALPLAFGTGLGSELRQPLGITIVGGLLASQLLTLYTTPVVYLALERLRPGDSRPSAAWPEPYRAGASWRRPGEPGNHSAPACRASAATPVGR